MDKKFKHECPSMFSTSMFIDMHNLATTLISTFSKEVKPVLLRCGVSDDEHIRRYLSSDSMKSVYEDALTLNGDNLYLFEKMAESFGQDFWEPMRDSNCTVKSPKEPGFVFKSLPLCGTPAWQKEKVLNCISLNDGKLFIDDQLLRQASIVVPTERHRELYDLVAQFCEEFNAKNYKNRSIRDLFVVGENGKIMPKAGGILFGAVGIY